MEGYPQKIMFACYDNVPCGGQVGTAGGEDFPGEWKGGLSRVNRVGVAGPTGETLVEGVSRASGCSGADRIPLLLWPVYAASRLVGLLPLAHRPTVSGSAPGQPGRSLDLRVSYPWLSLCVLALCVSLYAFNIELRRLVKLIIDPKTDLKDYVYAIPMLLTTAEGVICVVRALVAAKKLAQCLHAALSCLRKMSSLAASAAIGAGISPPPPATALNLDGFVLVLITLAYYTILIVAQTIYYYDHAYIETPADNAVFIWCRLVPLVVETQFLTVTLLADRAYRALATAVENVTSGYLPQPIKTYLPSRPIFTTSPPSTNRGTTSHTALLAELRRLHQKVFGMVELANEYFGPQLLCMVLQSRMQLITDSYSVVTSLSSDHSPYVHVLEACFLWTRIFHVIYRSERMVQQDERILHLVYTVDSSTWDSSASSQLHLLRRQVSALRPSLHTNSFFTLNYGLLLSIVATTSTYLVVLVQFQG